MKTISEIKENQEKWFSLEIYPPKNDICIYKLIEDIKKYNTDQLLCINIAVENNIKNTISIGENVLSYCNKNVMVHLVNNYTNDNELINDLDKLKKIGIQNIMVLGNTSNTNSPKYGIDLIKKIRKYTDNFFCLCVPGYPYKHPQSDSIIEDIVILKKKINAGADYVITQPIYDSDIYIDYVKKCKENYINVPIIPTIFPIQDYKSFNHIIRLSNQLIPNNIIKDINAIKNDDLAIRDYGIQYAINIGKNLLPHSNGIHFQTLNRLIALETIVKGLNLYNSDLKKHLPWKTSSYNRKNEDIRPIFWANNPEYYMSQTREWNDFPNGRWGNFKNPEFGEPDNFYLFKTKLWLERERYHWTIPLKSIDCISDIFIKFLNNKISGLPWCYECVQPETSKILNLLVFLTKNYIFPINSQPPLNGISSDDKVFGWGPPGGYIYQKGYLECFFPIKKIKNFNLKSNIFYYAKDIKGKIYTNNSEINTIGLTWGVFYNSEIVQPTIFNLDSFGIWCREAFSYWKIYWQNYYTKNSNAWTIIQEILEEYVLLVVIDNNYNIDTCDGIKEFLNLNISLSTNRTL